MTKSLAAFFLGGTISMGGASGPVVSRLGPGELLAAVPRLADLDVTVHPQDVERVPGGSLRFGQVLDVLRRARVASADGVVMVQGTDTIEETAFLLDLLWDDDAPIVVTGAMRNPTLPGADGPANLYAAACVASSAGARGRGALVVLNDEIHAARFVAKTHTSNPGAFRSPGVGPVGLLAEGAAVFRVDVPRRPALPVPDEVTVTVPLVTSVFSDDGYVLELIDERCDGLVLAGLGGGHVPDRVADRLGALAGRMPVLLASRTGAGQVLTRTYASAGSETDLIGRGLIPSGLLNAYQARVLLCVLLANGAGGEQVAEAVRVYGGDIP